MLFVLSFFTLLWKWNIKIKDYNISHQAHLLTAVELKIIVGKIKTESTK